MPIVPAKRFDAACRDFSEACIRASYWKHEFGAAYSTRLRTAITQLKESISTMEAILDEDES